jgi:branched-chain amino acid aminotransferase
MNNLIWFRNELIAEKDAKISVLSGSAQFGLNVFEGIRCYRSSQDFSLNAFRLDDHLHRLRQSCKLIGFDKTLNLTHLKENFSSVIRANQFSEDVAVRVTLLHDDIGSWHSSSPLTYFIAPIRKPRTDIKYLMGLKACISSWTRISDNVLPPRAKIGANYINGRFAHLAAKAAGYDLPILLNEHGTVSEGAGACVFMVKDQTLITPDNTSSILESITRDTVICLASDLGLDVVERAVDRTEIYLADEVFLCGTAAEITPICTVDQFSIGNGGVGPVCLSLLRKYHELVSGEVNKYSHWLSKID